MPRRFSNEEVEAIIQETKELRQFVTDLLATAKKNEARIGRNLAEAEEISRTNRQLKTELSALKKTISDNSFRKIDLVYEFDALTFDSWENIIKMFDSVEHKIKKRGPNSSFTFDSSIRTEDTVDALAYLRANTPISKFPSKKINK